MTVRYEIVQWTPELRDQIARLQAHLWSPDTERNSAYLTWKYLENPYIREPLLCVAMDGGRAVAMRGLFGAKWEAADADALVFPHADDFVVTPEHRLSGAARDVMRASLDQAARRGYPFAVSLGGGAATALASLASGWRFAGSFRMAQKRTIAVRVFEAAAARAGGVRVVWRARRALRELIPRATFERLDAARPTGAISVSATPRAGEMAALVARLPWDGRIRHVRDGEYFAWRFRNPLAEYRFVYWDHPGLQGYLVLSRSTADRRERRPASIVDLEASSPEIGVRLLAAALRHGRFSEIRTWMCGHHAAAAEWLTARAFVPVPGAAASRKGLLVARLPAEPVPSWAFGRHTVDDIGQWDLRMLYSMSG